MYKLAKGPSKFNVQNRRALPQQIDTSSDREELVNGTMSAQISPRPVFNSHINGKRSHNAVPASRFSESHLEVVRMLEEAWKKTERQLSESRNSKKGSSYNIVEYVERGEHPALQNFQPVDLKQLYLAHMYISREGT
ncbi:mapk-regulated corepressor-interacting protein 1-like [Amphiura filiformis]|uniref:mapk-regulated corepressor-interacting protein 1-like n=1 Tax=Amphiura filiformis TaxID=82378 RepID=UPI003B20E1D4